MEDIKMRAQASGRRCPSCDAPLGPEADECPVCEQSLCPECGVALDEEATRCPVCGTEFELACPSCGASLKPEHVYCIRCGVRFQPPPQALPPPRAAPSAPPVSAPPAPDPAQEAWEALPKVPTVATLTRDTGDVPTCSVCGRQDETVRAVVYPYVFSVIVVTYRRAFSGVWCAKHRNLRLALASFITATLGWLGIPFGLLYTPVVLLRLARGGDQPAESNMRLLSNLAERKLSAGDAHGAVRALEAALKFREDGAVWERLRELYRQHGAPTYEKRYRQLRPVVAVLLGAMVVGASVGVLSFVTAIGFSALFSGETPLYAAILGWSPLVGLAFVGGLILLQLIEGSLARLGCEQPSFAVSLALVSAAMMLYGLPEGRAIGVYVVTLATAGSFQSAGEAFSTGGAVLTRGGLWRVSDALGSGEPWGTIYVLILLACAVFYAVMEVAVARSTVNWQRRLAFVRAPISDQSTGSLTWAWAAIATVLIPLAILIGLFPQKSTVDYFEAITHHERGVTLLNRDQPDQAAVELREAVRLSPHWAQAHADLGWAYYEQGGADRRPASFSRGAATRPQHD